MIISGVTSGATVEASAVHTIRTSLSRLLRIDLPIVQAPIGDATSPALAAAVSNAGGLGMLAVSFEDIDAIRRSIRETRSLTDRPFGVNLILRWPQEERLKVCLEEGVEVVSFFWGDPSPHVEAVHSVGARVMHTISSANEARQAVDAGVDIIVAQGWEAGGHVWGEVATLPLVPRVADAVFPTPVVAAGGIADGRGIAAVLALGAAGAWVGTRFLMSEEALVPSAYRELLARASETDTVYSRVFDGGWPDAPHRALRNSTIKRWEKAGRPPSGRRPGEGEAIASFATSEPVQRYADVHPVSGMVGELEALALYAGQSVGLVTRTQRAGEIVGELADETVRVLERGAHLVERTEEA
jgi:NAD(P)H-dependent flavin oxidoreductase YrpB (nitropropane dioxygenase family)